MNLNTIFALLALALSAIAICQTYRFNKRQVTLGESQRKLNELLLQQGMKTEADSKKADFTAECVKTVEFVNGKSRNSYKVHIKNVGSVAAKNVRFKSLEEDSWFIEDDINSKFPLEKLDGGQTVKLIAAVTFESKLKQPIKLTWDDESGENHVNEIVITFP